MSDRIFKDSAGTPAGYGDTVELIKDKLGNDRLGPELVVNGDFDTDTDWSKGTGWTISGGVASYDASVNGGLAQAGTIPEGRLLEITFTISNVESGKVAFFRVDGSGTGTPLYRPYTEYTEGTYTFIFQGSAGDRLIGFHALNFGNGGSFSIDNISVREVIGSHAIQTSASLKPVYGRVPVGGRRNDLADSVSAPTTSTGVDITEAGHVTGLGPAYTVTATTENLNNAYVEFRANKDSVIGQRDRSSVYVRAETTSTIHIYMYRIAGSRMAEQTVTIPPDGQFHRIDLLGPAWEGERVYFFRLYPTARLEGRQIGDSFTFVAPQLEIDTGAATPYQRVTSGLDVYEEGQQHIEYLRFDGVDDRMSQTFPDGFEGDLIVCGTKGSWVDEGVSIPPGGELTIGPKNLPNTPNILPALGDIIGWVPVSRTTTEEERQRIIEYYKGRGAKGRLVEGPELVENGVIDQNSTLQNWEKLASDTVLQPTAEGLKVTVGDGYVSAGVRYKVGGLNAGDVFVHKMSFVEVSPQAFHNMTWGGGKAPIQSYVTKPSNRQGIYDFVVQGDGKLHISGFVRRNYGATLQGDYIVINNVSVKKLIPEEDLA